LFFLGGGEDRDDVRSREVLNETKDWGFRGESSLFCCIIWTMAISSGSFRLSNIVELILREPSLGPCY
jgi:hypothetical protein